uniref:Uncharacterized protein n=1 Tax=Anguilla anguilla TaxID=7936 RepID=A0A0E9P8T4_ANGAN
MSVSHSSNTLHRTCREPSRTSHSKLRHQCPRDYLPPLRL